MCKEGTCKCKEICAKMQEAGLRESLKNLRKVNGETKAVIVRSELEHLENILTSYECLPVSCLMKRIEWVRKELHLSKYCLHEDSRINALVKEIEAFLDSQNA